jgi:hypothetical protein
MRIIVESLPPKPPKTEEHKTEKKFKNALKVFNTVAQLGAVVIAILLLCVTSRYVTYTYNMWREMHQQTIAATGQLKQEEAKHNHPWVWVKMPDSITIKIGKPVTAKICVFNYGEGPALVRTKIRLKVAPNAIEELRKGWLQPETIIPWQDTKGNLRLILAPNEGSSDFPVDSPQEILTRDKYRQIMTGVSTGTIDVVVYGRLFYATASTPAKEYDSIFCFYLLKDGKTSACTDEQGAYTNWMNPTL